MSEATSRRKDSLAGKPNLSKQQAEELGSVSAAGCAKDEPCAYQDMDSYYAANPDKKPPVSATAPSASSPPKPATAPSKSTKLPSGSWDTKDSAAFKSDWYLNGAKVGRQSLPFMFEIQEKGKPIWEMVLPFNPEGYKMVYAPRVNHTLTQAGIFEDNIGVAPPKFTISGVFGYVGTTLMGIAKSLDKDAKTGLQLYHEMETRMLYFYERYGMKQLDGKDVSEKIDPKNKPVLFFYNFCDQEYWQVQVTQFTLNRNIQRRHLYQYEIQMTGLKRADRKDEQDVLSRLASAQNSRIDAAKAAEAANKVGLWDSFMQKAGSLVKGIQGAVGKATAVFQKVQNEVTKLKSMMTQISTAVQGFSSGLTDLVHVPLDLVQTAKQSADSIMASLDQISGLPNEFTQDMRQIQRLLNGYTKQPELFKRPDPAKQTTSTNSVEILSIELPDQLKTAGATGMLSPEQTIFADGIETPKLVAASQIQLNDSDTIATIANKAGVDWKAIVAINGLEYPYIAQKPIDLLTPTLGTYATTQAVNTGATLIEIKGISAKVGNILSFEDGSVIAEIIAINGDIVQLAAAPQNIITGKTSSTMPAYTTIRVHQRMLSVAMAGDMLLIPGDPKTVNSIITNGQDFEDTLYGIDEILDTTGNMQASNTLDISTVSGLNNLEMQLRHRINTVKGELSELGHPEYGSNVPLFIGKTMTPVWQERILLECRLAVESDPRVLRTANSDFYNIGTSIYFTTDVYPINSQNPITVSIPLT